MTFPTCLRLTILVALLSLTGGCADSSPVRPAPACAADALRTALASARNGDAVEVGACRIAGSFVVPAGVTLRGVGSDASTIASTEGRGLDITTTVGTTTTIEGIAIESTGDAGLVARGAGALMLLDVAVSVTRGIGIGTEDATAVLRDVRVNGPVTDSGAATVATPGDPATTGTFGLLAVRGVLDARGLDAEGFASAAIAIVDADSELRDVDVGPTVGVGIALSGGRVRLERVAVSRTLHGSGTDAVAILADRGAIIDSIDVRVDRSEGFGLFASAAGTQSHIRLIATANAMGGVVTTGSGRLELSGAGTAFDDNGFVGVLVTAGGSALISDAVIGRTRLASVAGIMAGDGIQLVDPTDDSSIVRTSVIDNVRAGMVIDGGGTAHLGLMLGRMLATGTGTAYGCLDQNGTFSDTWDTDVERSAVVFANDEGFEMMGLPPLDVVAVVGPGMLTDLGAISVGGLESSL